MISNTDLATRLLETGQFVEALAAFRTACDANPDNWYAWYGAGQAARFLSDFAAAVTYLERAAALAPSRSSTLLALGIALQLHGKLPSAFLRLSAAIQIDPDFVEAFNSLAITHKLMGQLDTALETFDAG